MIHNKEAEFLYIPTGSSIENVTKLLVDKNYIMDRNSFEWLAEKKKYKFNVKPGRYRIKNKMSNNELINLLRSGIQVPVKLTFNNVRTVDEFAGVVSRKLEPDSMAILTILNNDKVLSEYGFNKSSVPALFISNTYEMYWNTDVRDFIIRMYKEYNKFWNGKRRKLASEIGLTPVEVTTVASIVFEETSRQSEYSAIAGVYINRIKKGMKLQADPTVKFAMHNFSLKRIYTKYLEYDSHYNTYKYQGLPPGPICFPSVQVIDAVLNYEHHKYLYFCAKDDLSGTHNFSTSLMQHNAYARKYQTALDKNSVKK